MQKCSAELVISANKLQVALSELHSIANERGVYSAEFNISLNIYVSAYSDIQVLYHHYCALILNISLINAIYLNVLGNIVINRASDIILSQPAYLLVVNAR